MLLHTLLCVFVFFFFLSCISSSLFPAAAAAASASSSICSNCNHQDISALLQFKDSFQLDCSIWYDSFLYYPKTSSWIVKNLTARWNGVYCHRTTGRVIELDLSLSCLQGPINSTSPLFQLHHLERLNLAYNDFSVSKIPSSLGNLSRLTHLNLSSAHFDGEIPLLEMSKLSKLSSLDLSDNSVLKVVDLKRLIQNLTNLEELDLSSSSIESNMPADDTFTNMSSLRSLNLRGCGLHGEFPLGIFYLPNLLVLDMRSNPDLRGSLPDFHNSSNALESILLAFTQFSGNIPSSIGNLGSLRTLDLSGCGFSGSLPRQLGNLGFLRTLDLSGCGFSGSLPPQLGNLGSLRTLDLSGCGFSGFSGSLPPQLGNLGSLRTLDLSGCGFSGSLPPQLGNLGSLRTLDLSGCGFSGSFPPHFGSLGSLRTLDLSYCGFSGSLPPQIGNLTDLTSLDLSYNQLTGRIPQGLTNLTQLSILYLDNNQLFGEIPWGIMNLTKLTELGLSFNKLQGPINPTSFSSLKNLQTLGLHNNRLSGELDLDIFIQFQDLERLVLSSNYLTVVRNNSSTKIEGAPTLLMLGLSSCRLTKFPEFLRDQHQLEYLDLSDNRIEGPIPKWMMNVSVHYLSILNVSHNLITNFTNTDDPHELLTYDLPWQYLMILDISFNKIQGSVPVPPPTSQIYFASNNEFSGELSPLICALPTLYVLELSNNNLTGELPDCVGRFSKALHFLNLRNNSFGGRIPQLCAANDGMGKTLEMIDLNGNFLEGKLPRSLSNCTELEFLDLGNNLIQDDFPSWLGSLQHLSIIILRANMLHGPLLGMSGSSSRHQLQFPKLRIIDLSHNNLSGELPASFFQQWTAMKRPNLTNIQYMGPSIRIPLGLHIPLGLVGLLYSNDKYQGDAARVLKHLRYSVTLNIKEMQLECSNILDSLFAIDLSDNSFQGNIPVTLWSLKGLLSLNLSRNHLTGSIPSAIENLRQLESLDLSFNMFSERIPLQLKQLTFLSYFNVSRNNLTGQIPSGGQMDIFENSSYIGNSGLCGPPLSRKCESSKRPEPQAPEMTAKKHGKFWKDFNGELGWLVVLIGFGGGLVIGVAVEYILDLSEPIMLFWRRRRIRRRRQPRRNNN